MDTAPTDVSPSGGASLGAGAPVVCALCGAESALPGVSACSNCGNRFIGGHSASVEDRRCREVVVFSGALSVRRAEAAAAASAAGWQVATNVSGRTTLLVVGVQETRKLAGCERSTKQRKAESLIAGGQKIRIVDEGEFRRLIDSAGGSVLLAPQKNESKETRRTRQECRMTCSRCGASEHSASSAFCTRCGARMIVAARALPVPEHRSWWKDIPLPIRLVVWIGAFAALFPASWIISLWIRFLSS